MIKNFSKEIGDDMNIKDISQLLVKVPLFNGYSISSVTLFLKETEYQIKTYKKNETVFFRGDFITNVNILIKGTLIAEMQKFNGNSIVISHIKTSEILAPAFIFGEDNTFPVDLITLEEVKLLMIDRDKFFTLIQKNEKLLLNFIDEISNKSQYLSKRIWFNFVNKTIGEKVLSYIKKNSKNDKIKFSPNISSLAKKFDVTRPALSREISNLCKKNILKKVDKNTYLVNFDKFSQKNI